MTKLVMETLAELRPGCSMTVETIAGLPKIRQVYKLLNLSAGTTYGVHNPTLLNVVRGILERVMLHSDGTPPPPITADFRRLKPFTNAMRKHRVKVAPLTEDEFLLHYVGRKLMVYRKAVDSLHQVPVSRRDAVVSTFVKAEKLNLTKKADPAPRVIQPRTPRYNVEVGRYLKHLEPIIYKSIKKVFGEHTVFKGMNALEQGRRLRSKWDKYEDPVFVGGDIHRFDQHVQEPWLRWEHKQYGGYYSGIDRHRLFMLLAWQLLNRGVARVNEGIVRYVVEGCRMSGDMNTALGNCLIVCALVWTYQRERGIEKASWVDNGDDWGVILERRDLAKLLDQCAEWFLEWGFIVALEEPVDVFERIEFCQCRPVWTPDGYIMVRNPVDAVDKDLVSFNNINNEAAWRQACQSIGVCGLHLAGHIPIFSQLYRKLAKIGKGATVLEPEITGMWWLARGLDNSSKPVHPRTRDSFHTAYGITPDAQAAMEAILRDYPEIYAPNRSGMNNIPDLHDLC